MLSIKIKGGYLQTLILYWILIFLIILLTSNKYLSMNISLYLQKKIHIILCSLKCFFIKINILTFYFKSIFIISILNTISIIINIVIL